MFNLFLHLLLLLSSHLSLVILDFLMFYEKNISSFRQNNSMIKTHWKLYRSGGGVEVFVSKSCLKIIFFRFFSSSLIQFSTIKSFGIQLNFPRLYQFLLGWKSQSALNFLKNLLFFLRLRTVSRVDNRYRNRSLGTSLIFYLWDAIYIFTPTHR